MSGVRESNSRLDIGNVVYYHYINPAFCLIEPAAVLLALQLTAGR